MWRQYKNHRFYTTHAASLHKISDLKKAQKNFMHACYLHHLLTLFAPTHNEGEIYTKVAHTRMQNPDSLPHAQFKHTVSHV